MSPVTPQPNRRRADDDRIDVLIDRIGDAVSTLGVVANDVAYLKKAADQSGAALNVVTARLAEVTADLAASPAGREALRRIQASEHRIDVHDEEISSLKRWRLEFGAELRTTLRLMKGIAALVTAISFALTALWTMHLLGWF